MDPRSTSQSGVLSRLTAALTALLAALTVIVVASPAQAGAEHSPPWRWTKVTEPRTPVPIGSQYDATLSCPAGYRPVSWIWGSSFDNAGTTLTLQGQTLDYANNSGTLRVYNSTSHDDAVDATLNCVNAADIGTVTTKTQAFSHTVGNIGGFVQCNLGDIMIGGSASWDVTGPNTRIDFVAPTSSGWYVTGNATAWIGTLTVSVHCVAGAVASGVHIAQTSSTANPNADGLVSATADCVSGERVATAGAYEHPDGETISATKTLGSIRSVSQFSFETLTSGATVKVTEPNSTTTLVVFAICLPYATPSVEITSGPTGLQGSGDIAFTFTASDPANYDLTFSCAVWRVVGPFSSEFYRLAPCDRSGTNVVTGIEDGSYQLSVSAKNGDFKTDADILSFQVDVTAPSAGLSGQPETPTTATTASFMIDVTDDHPSTTYCHLDGAPETACPSPASYSDLADGLHTFHWRATDTVGHETTGQYTWRVDTLVPTAALTAPSAAFTSAASARVAWSGSDGGSGVGSWQVQWQRARYDGGFGAWSSPTSYSGSTTSHTYTGLARGYDYCFRVRAIDAAGNTSAYSPRRCTSVLLDDRSLAASSAWTRITGSHYYAGTATSGKKHGAVLTRTHAQLDRLALLVTKCSGCGTVGVYVGTTLIAKVSLAATSTRNRQLIAVKPFSYRSGTVTVKILSRRKLVRVDGLGIART
jgi:hypothetical protein